MPGGNVPRKVDWTDAKQAALALRHVGALGAANRAENWKARDLVGSKRIRTAVAAAAAWESRLARARARHAAPAGVASE